MSEALLNAGRQTLMLELQEASRLPERLGDDFVRAANIILHCEGKVVVRELANRATLVRKIAATLASTGTPAFCPSGRSAARRSGDDRKPRCDAVYLTPVARRNWI